MPEKVTKEESMVQKAIEAARLAKQMLEATGSAFEIPDAEEVKVKRPKAEKDKTKPKKTEDTHSGYGSAGDEDEYKIKKAEGYDMVLEDVNDIQDAKLAIESFLQAVSSKIHYDKPTVPVPEKLMGMVYDYLEKGFDKKRF